MQADRRPIRTSRDYFPLLDLLRGLAAFLVVLEHARNYLWVDFRELEKPSQAIKAIYFVSHFGHEAVMIFFVLSGCVVGRIAVQRCEQGRWNWRFYLFERMSRLWIVLLPALVLTAVIDRSLVAWTASTSFVHSGGFANIQAMPISGHIGMTDFAGNLFFLQTIAVPTFGSNGPLWSLANEFWYYLVFPAIWVGIFGTMRLGARAGHVGFGLVVLWAVGPAIAGAFPIWLLGVGAYLLGRDRDWNPHLRWTGLGLSTVCTLAALAATRAGRLGVWGSPLIGIGVAAIIVFGMNVQLPLTVQKVCSLFSSFSYSLYLVHLPLLTLMVAPFIADNHARLQPGAIGIEALAVSMMVAYGVAYGFYFLTERNTGRIRAWLGNKTGL